ncbi:MAG: GNAT superfamily N-acetyltransferase [Chlamydiales bacterium]|jgi:GNAT superfamily N-acetyltransferase
MEVKLSIAETLDEALSLSAAIDGYAAEVSADYRDTPPAAGLGQRLLERHFGRPETVVALARAERPEPIGMCVTIPFEDPLFGDAVPFVAVLFVDSSFRHRGLAGLLVRSVQETLAGRGIGSLAGRAGHNDDALISMGERWGFVRQWEWMLRD